MTVSEANQAILMEQEWLPPPAMESKAKAGNP